MPIDEAAALPEEAPLVEAGADGRERLRRIVVEHHATLWRFLRRMGVAESDVDDAIQEVLLVVMRKLDRIEPGRERAYLLSTGYRVGSRIRAKRAPSSGGAIRDPRPGPEALLDQKRAREMLDRILVAMPEDLRAAHDRNDEVLERIYIGRRFKNDTERLEKLFEMYTKMTTKVAADG